MNSLGQKWNEFTKWLNAHPNVKGALALLEGTVTGYVMDYFSNPNPELTAAGFKHLAIVIGGAVFVAERNYFKDRARAQWTPETRQAMTSPVIPAPPVIRTTADPVKPVPVVGAK